MKIEDIEIHAGRPSAPFKVIGPIKAQVGAATVFSKTPTMDDVNQKLREQAAKMGATAVINISYDRGVSMTSWKALTASGTAVVLLPQPKVETPKVATPTNIEVKLTALNGLKQKGLITEEEYQAKRTAILSEL